MWHKLEAKGLLRSSEQTYPVYYKKKKQRDKNFWAGYLNNVPLSTNQAEQ